MFSLGGYDGQLIPVSIASKQTGRVIYGMCVIPLGYFGEVLIRSDVSIGT